MQAEDTDPLAVRVRESLFALLCAGGWSASGESGDRVLTSPTGTVVVAERDLRDAGWSEVDLGVHVRTVDTILELESASDPVERWPRAADALRDALEYLGLASWAEHSASEREDEWTVVCTVLGSGRWVLEDSVDGQVLVSPSSRLRLPRGDLDPRSRRHRIDSLRADAKRQLESAAGEDYPGALAEIAVCLASLSDLSNTRSSSESGKHGRVLAG